MFYFEKQLYERHSFTSFSRHPFFNSSETQTIRLSNVYLNGIYFYLHINNIYISFSYWWLAPSPHRV